jgi:hypothetical protein
LRAYLSEPACHYDVVSKFNNTNIIGGAGVYLGENVVREKEYRSAMVTGYGEGNREKE